MNIVIVGTGYVGLVSGTCFADAGNKVTCVDIDQWKVEKLKSGKITIYEPGLEKIFLKNIQEKRLNFSSNLSEVLDFAQIVFLALPTPMGSDGSADLKYVLDVADSLGKLLNKYTVIVNKSTVPVGTADRVRASISANYKGEFDVVSNPEFLKEGVALNDFMMPSRVVIGTSSEKAKRIMRELYSSFIKVDKQLIFMDERSAELTKYAANSFLATKISFMNEIAQLCERMGANVDMVRNGIGSNERIGENFLFSGIGYGGSCFPKDVQALIKSSGELNYVFKILEAVEKVNDLQKKHLVEKIKVFYDDNLYGKHFAMWGLAFKPNTDDIRDSPALSIIEALLSLGATITAYDPEAMQNVKNQIGGKINYAENQFQALNNADALIIATEWSDFRNANLERVENEIKHKVIFDGRNLFEVKNMREQGFEYISIGREF